MQHRIIVMDYRMKTPRKKQTRKINKQIRWWKLKKEEARTEYQASVTTNLDEIGLDLDWNRKQEILVSTANEKLGQTNGKADYNEKESLWWNEDTRSTIKSKRRSKHTRKIRVKNSTVHTGKPTREQKQWPKKKHIKRNRTLDWIPEKEQR